MQSPPFLSRRAFLRRATKDKNHLQFVLWQHLLVNQGVKTLSTAQMTDSGDDTSKKESKIPKETTVSLPAFEDNPAYPRVALSETSVECPRVTLGRSLLLPSVCPPPSLARAPCTG